jgi:hypothetical protein
MMPFARRPGAIQQGIVLDQFVMGLYPIQRFALAFESATAPLLRRTKSHI